jgi:hypothetical protein
MHPKLPRKRARKHLLMAAMGVATVSYITTQSGCAPDADAADEETTAAYDDEQAAPEVSEQGQALRTTLSTDITSVPIKIIVLPPVGNLMAPPVGNLMAPPVIKDPIVVPVLPPVGNLMPPPVLETVSVDELELKR